MSSDTQGGAPIDQGKAAPAFTLSDQAGQTHRLADYRGRWVVLYFYPKDDTPGCTTEACQFRDQHGDVEAHGAAVLGVSPDDEASHGKFAAKFDLPFALLADADAAVCRQYGVWQEKNLYGKKRMGVVRTTYLIDPRGKVAHRWDKVKADGHAAEVLAKLATVQG